MKLSQVSAAPDKANGVWIKFDEEGCEFFIASTSRPEFQKAINQHRRGIPGFKANRDDVAARIYTAALCDACLLDWKGVNEEDGSPMPCTPENKARAMAVPMIREFVSLAAGDIANFQAEALAEDAETLKSLS